MAGVKRIERRVASRPTPNFLRRVYFMNKQHSKYISLGFYPDLENAPHVEIGSSRQVPIVLTPYLFSILALHLPKLCQHLCNGLPYKCSELCFRLQITNHGKQAKISLNKRSIGLKCDELNYLLSNMVFLQNQLARYEIALPNVTNYMSNAKSAKTFVQPDNNACPFILYDVLFDELKGNLV